ncbi:polyprenol monophosphomannose synthase [Micrococcales bacterium 31B]|nr:polyprenol monophosphomannose synthase [Micrococcales bacterium 31B]
MKYVVTIPTYNEIANLEMIVGRVRAAVPEVDILILDDNSPDGTGDLADQIAARDPQVSVMHRTAKEGLGAAYIAGFREALARGYDVVIEMDADGSHRPEQLHRILQKIEDGNDLVLGSRWVPGGAVHNWPLHRELLSRGGNLYTRIMLGMRVKDATGGYRAFRRHVLERLQLETVASQGYCFQVDLAYRASRLGVRVVEAPIDFDERVEGVSKMSGNIVQEALWRVTVWGLRRPPFAVRRALTGTRRGRS